MARRIVQRELITVIEEFILSLYKNNITITEANKVLYTLTTHICNAVCIRHQKHSLPPHVILDSFTVTMMSKEHISECTRGLGCKMKLFYSPSEGNHDHNTFSCKRENVYVKVHTHHMSC